MKKILPLLLILAIVFISCTSNAVNPADIDTTTWEGLFKVYWNVMNEDYVHFSRNDLNWDDVYNEYLPKFKELNYDDAKDSLTAFRYFKEIAEDITDYHYNLTVVDKNGSSLSFSPSKERKWSENPLNSHKDDIYYYPDVAIKVDDDTTEYKNVNGDTFTKDEKKAEDIYIDGNIEVSTLIEKKAFHESNYASFDYEISGDITAYNFEGDSNIQKAAWLLFLDALDEYVANDLQFYFGITNTNVAYFYFSQFPAYEILDVVNESTNTRRTYKDIPVYNKLSESAKEYVAEFSRDLNTALDLLGEIANEDKVEIPDSQDQDTKTTHDVNGVVIDVRSNGGGALEFINLLAGIFFQKDTTKVVGQTRYKMGYDKYSYTPWYDMVVNGINERGEDYPNHVAIITNGSSVSCSEITTITLREFLNCEQFGSTTWGGTCGLNTREIYQSGPYTLKNSDGDTMLEIYTTTYQFRDNSGNSYEGIGVTPTRPIEEYPDRDFRFEEAISWAAKKY